jgi:hypothetical protein
MNSDSETEIADERGAHQTTHDWRAKYRIEKSYSNSRNSAIAIKYSAIFFFINRPAALDILFGWSVGGRRGSRSALCRR